MARKRVPPALLLAIPGLLGTGLVAYATAAGAGASPDSAVYLGAARGLIAGEGLVVPDPESGRLAPLAHFPPLYPALLAAGGLAGGDPWRAARWISALLFGANAMLVGLAVRRASGSAACAALAAAIALFSVDLLYVHVHAWSEPLAIGLGTGALLAAAHHAASGGRGSLLAAALLSALALLTRFAALPLVAAAALGILWRGRGGVRERGRRAALYAGLSLAPLALWLARSRAVAGTAANRELALHRVSAEHLESAAATAAGWVAVPGLPGSARPLLLALALLGGAALVAGLARRDRRADPAERDRISLLWMLALTVACSAAFLAVSISLFDFDTPLDRRILAPLHVAAIAFAVGAAGLLARGRGRALGAALLAAGIVFAGLRAEGARRPLLRWHEEIPGYASRAWRDSRLVAEIADLPPARVVYTNDPWGVFLVTGRVVRSIPWTVDVTTARPRADFAGRLDTVRREVEAGDALVFDLRFAGWSAELPERAALRAALEAAPRRAVREGVVYGHWREADAGPEGAG